MATVWAVAPGARRPFVANLAEGRPASPQGSRRAARFEYPRSARYRHLYQETSAGPALHTILAEGLFEVEPLPGSDAEDESPVEADGVEPARAGAGADGAGAPASPSIRYVTLVPRSEAVGAGAGLTADAATWIEGLDLDRALDQLRVDPRPARPGDADGGDPEPRVPAWAVGLALWWIAQLDRRVVAPVIHEPGFALQAFLAALVATGTDGEHRGAPGRFTRRDHAAVTVVAPRADGTDYGRGLRAVGDPWLFAPAAITVASEAALQRILAREILIWTRVRALRAGAAASGRDVSEEIDAVVATRIEPVDGVGPGDGDGDGDELVGDDASSGGGGEEGGENGDP